MTVCQLGQVILEPKPTMSPELPSLLSRRAPRDQVVAAILNKPPGFVSARKEGNPRNRPTVYDCLPEGWDTPKRPISHCGRLDLQSSGLLLFTNDGLLEQALLNRRFRHEQSEGLTVGSVEKVYHVRTPGRVAPSLLSELAEPLRMGGHQAKRLVATLPAQVRILGMGNMGSWLEFTITEGRNRQVRRLCGRSRLPVAILRRVALGPLRLGNLPEGAARILSQEELNACYELALPGVKIPRLCAF